MTAKNAYLVDGPLPEGYPPFSYESPWSYASLATRVNAIPAEDCCRGLVNLILEIAREADLRLAKALFDNWALEGILRDK